MQKWANSETSSRQYHLINYSPLAALFITPLFTAFTITMTALAVAFMFAPIIAT
jgi:hypothetical protein